jgi:hypothetical protein
VFDKIVQKLTGLRAKAVAFVIAAAREIFTRKVLLVGGSVCGVVAGYVPAKYGLPFVVAYTVISAISAAWGKQKIVEDLERAMTQAAGDALRGKVTAEEVQSIIDKVKAL